MYSLIIFIFMEVGVSKVIVLGHRLPFGHISPEELLPGKKPPG